MSARRDALLAQHRRELAALAHEEARAVNIERSDSCDCDCCGETYAAPQVVCRGERARSLVICAECRQYGNDL